MTRRRLVTQADFDDIPIEAYDDDAVPYFEPDPEWLLEPTPEPPRRPVTPPSPQPDPTPEPAPEGAPMLKLLTPPPLPDEERYRTPYDISQEFMSRQPDEDLIAEEVQIDIGSPHELAVRALLDVAGWHLRPVNHGHIKTATNALCRAPILETDGQIYRYHPDSGMWHILPQDELERAFVWYDGKAYGEESKSGKRRTITLTMGMRDSGLGTALSIIRRPNFFDDVRPGFAFRSGFVSVGTSSEKPLNFESKSPWHLARYAYDFDMPDITTGIDDPMHAFWAKVCPTWHYMLHSCLPGRVEEVRFLQEFIAASRAGIATNYQYALMLLGDIKGANGKSTTMDAIKLMFPPEGVVHCDPLTWSSDPFHELPMVGALINIIHETDPLAFARQIKTLKGLATGNERETRRLGGQRFSYKPRAGQIFAANELPRGGGKEGILRRFCLLEFREKFTGDRKVEAGRLLAGIRREMPGIVLWLLCGLHGLLKRQRMLEPPSSLKLREIWETGSSNALTFVARCADRSEVLSTDVKLAFRAYLQWCEAENIAPRNILDGTEFRKTLLDAGHTIAPAKEAPVTKHYFGFKVRPPKEWE